MGPVVYFLGICALLVYSFTWLLPRLISFILAKKFKITIRFGRIGLPFTLLNVEICKNGYSVHIDEIGIRSRMINSEVTKWLTISIRDIRINKDILVENGKPPATPEEGKELLERELNEIKRKVIDFRDKKVPTSIINFAQFMAVHVYNMSLVLRNQSEPKCGWFLHATASELHMDGSIVHNEKTLIVTAAMTDAQAKLFRITATDAVPPGSPTSLGKRQKIIYPAKASNCLMEFSFGIQLEMIMVAQGPIAIEKLQLIMNNSKVTIHCGFYGFIHDLKTHKKPKRLQQVSRNGRTNESEFDIDCLTPIIPRNFIVKINDTLVTAINEDSSNDFLVELKSLALSGVFASRNRFQATPEEDVPILKAGIKLSLLELNTSQDKLFFVESLQIDGNLHEETLNLYTKISTLQVTYNHADIMAWVVTNIMKSMEGSADPATTSKPMSLAEAVRPKGRSNVVEKFLGTVIVNGCAELYNMSLVVQIAGHDNVAVNLNHLKLLLNQDPEPRAMINQLYRNKAMNAILANRHWSTELMVESFWWSMDGGQKEPGVNLKKTHVRGSPFYLGVCLLKISSYGSSQTKLDVSLHTLRFEYNNRITKFLLDTINCVNEYRALSGEKVVRVRKSLGNSDYEKSAVEASDPDSMLIINGTITDFSLFLFNKHESCILLSLAELTAARTMDMNVVRFSGIEAAIQNNPQSEDLPHIFTNIKVIRIELIPKTEICDHPQVSAHILNDTEFLWDPNLHMHAFTLVEELKEFKKELKSITGKTDAPSTVPLAYSKPKRVLPFEIIAEGNTIFGIKMHDRHSMQVFLENFYFGWSKELVCASVENIFMHIDDVHMGSVKDLRVQQRPELDILTKERMDYENFKNPTNSVWITQIGCLNFIFPYNHEFSDAIQNEMVSLYKWIKLVHNIKKKEFTIHSKLPHDMYININEFLVEMSDDPFEVKLRDNYVLLKDEYQQAEERKELLEKKLAERYADNLLISGKTIEELHNRLTQLKSEIYIQRSKKIYEAGPTRTRLFAWIMTDIKISAMADPSIHGTENVTRIMQEIDHESPWPDEGLEFVTLWCRAINVSCTEWKFMLRDYQQPMFLVKQMRLFGNLCGAEQLAPRRARREVVINVGDPFGTMTVQRSMTALKFYHDLDMEMDECKYAFGPCWEPVMAQYNLSFEKISAPSKDPSPLMPFWDKMRLLMHGRLTFLVKQFTILLHASLDPYNTTEEMELTWNNCGIVWTNAKMAFKGDFNVSVKTASRYDDCRLLHFPNLKLNLKLNWICLANPNDHHAVIPCAPDKLPEHSSNQVHDSFRAFRSQNLNIWLSFETKAAADGDVPTLVLFGSTLRWFESLQLILSGVTRPTRRGLVFNNIRAKKKQLSRHYKKMHLQMSLHKFQIMYWVSHAMQRGFELNGGRVTFSSEQTLSIVPIDDGLIHRPRSDWATVYMNCELNDSEIWLKSVLTADSKTDASSEHLTADMKIVKFYFLSLAKVSYGRETKIANNEKHKDSPMHKLVVYDLKGAWTKNNRDVAFALFDSFMKTQRLKKNLGTEALKCYGDGNNGNTQTPLKSRRHDSISSTSTGSSVATAAGSASASSAAGSSSGGAAGAAGAPPFSSSKTASQANSNAINMLQKLIAEQDHKFNVYSDDLSAQNREQQLHGLQACQGDDVTHYNWFISLVNSQVLLKGCETSGYVILSAAKAEILQRVHRPVWRDRSIVSKTTWIGSLECMQYYATVSARHNDSLLDENIMWLTVDNIQKDKEATVINELPDLPHLVGSGQSVGGVVSETVGAVNMAPGGVPPIELQRIVSRCKCEFFYVSYGETSIDPGTLIEVPTPPSEDTLSPWERRDDPMDAFTLMHHDLDVFTNSLQYAMIMDILNNLLLYVEPQRKEASEKLARKRFQLQLSSVEDQKRPIQHLQTEVRSLMSQMRSLEKDIHLISKARLENAKADTEEVIGDEEELEERQLRREQEDLQLAKELEDRQLWIRTCKEKLNVLSDELDMSLSCYKESQLSAMNKSAAIIRKDKPVTILRANEICFKHATWRLTETDGQIGIADLILSHFLYTKNSRSDDSVEHLLELGYIRMLNLIPREIYVDVLLPTEPQQDMPVDHQRVLRVFCRERHPVGGISVKEHFEINVVPIAIAITKKFYTTMLRFCFPENTSDPDAELDEATGKSKKAIRAKKSAKDSEFYVKIPKDDVEKMKERAEKNKLFIYIKIPEVPVRVSYKGNKEKNIEDISNFSLVIPTLEYHNVTWTWLDLLLAMKSDSRRVIVSQAIKQKLQINRNKTSFAGEKPSPQEEDKARMLFGNRSANENKSQRKGGGVFKFNKP